MGFHCIGTPYWQNVFDLVGPKLALHGLLRFIRRAFNPGRIFNPL
jgi:hypothetical protein